MDRWMDEVRLRCVSLCIWFSFIKRFCSFDESSSLLVPGLDHFDRKLRLCFQLYCVCMRGIVCVPWCLPSSIDWQAAWVHSHVEKEGRKESSRKGLIKKKHWVKRFGPDSSVPASVERRESRLRMMSFFCEIV
mmetsp:Transcript_16275/g.32996  ORF Transcript_16275/g.32996 Transcript_16275/m.32996 type:complete len:133 (+) Transcript_16275:929-1327(+)